MKSVSFSKISRGHTFSFAHKSSCVVTPCESMKVGKAAQYTSPISAESTYVPATYLLVLFEDSPMSSQIQRPSEVDPH